MNLIHVHSRECVLIGTGKIPKNEVTQVAKEFASLSDAVVWSYRYLPSDEANTPTSVLTQLVAISDPDVTAFVTYDIVLKDHPDWMPFGWGGFAEYEEDDLVVLWLLNDDPPEDEVNLVKEAMAAGCQVFVMNEGLWEVDKIDETGMYEKVGPPPTESTVTTVMTMPAEAEPEPVPVPERAESGPLTTDSTPAPEQTPYDNLSRQDLKVLLDERGLKADRRSIDSMVQALVEADQAGPDALVLSLPVPPSDDVEDLDSEAAENFLQAVAEEDNHPSLGEVRVSEDTTVLLLMRQAAETLQDIARMNATLAGVMIQITKELTGDE